MQCIHGLGAKSCLHVTLVFSRRILISALEAARSFGHHAVRVHTQPFVLQSSTSLCNASCNFVSTFSFSAGQTHVFYSWTRLFCCFASKHMSLVLLFLIAADDFSTDQVAKVATTRTRLVVEQICCTSASRQHCFLFHSMTCSFFTQAHFTLALHQGVQSASSMRSTCPRLTTKKTTIFGTYSWVL